MYAFANNRAQMVIGLNIIRYILLPPLLIGFYLTLIDWVMTLTSAIESNIRALINDVSATQ